MTRFSLAMGPMSAIDAVDGSSTGTRVPKMRVLQHNRGWGRVKQTNGNQTGHLRDWGVKLSIEPGGGSWCASTPVGRFGC